ncbi:MULTISPECIES: hypothetical protein [Sedimentisphaera]|uniref:Uncharacterized protein n=2 Tax=Sedimentisphaera TaxID=2483368 RepID=A0A1W6LNS4_9BACT|nr:MULTISPECIES: hypothetical protein [Sedimentisphaera]AQQ09665.1 hypothetical protein L21SP3_01475 [Sedimentisphaera cyanobacteriorum]ARN57376.1 hypothetical protein STSP1_01781 [Sedimentisphaera salicampi]OXU14581.1 hypothetical protein SMSP1_01688 [Sedimentisphaera salicampi]
MDALEQKVTKTLEKSGWRTEVRDGVDMVGYRPRTKKMFYGNMFHLCHDHEIDMVLKHDYSH